MWPLYLDQVGFLQDPVAARCSNLKVSSHKTFSLIDIHYQFLICDLYTRIRLASSRIQHLSGVQNLILISYLKLSSQGTSNWHTWPFFGMWPLYLDQVGFQHDQAAARQVSRNIFYTKYMVMRVSQNFFRFLTPKDGFSSLCKTPWLPPIPLM